MKTTQKQIEKTIEHPLEAHFNIEPNTTVATHTERETELVEMNSYDDKDIELEITYQEIYDKALDAYDRLQDEMEDAEVKYIPRLSEVSNGILNTALAAANSKARLKEHKDKQHTKKSTASNGPRTVNNNIVISREEFLEKLLKGDSPLPPARPQGITVTSENIIDVAPIQDTGKNDDSI